MGNDNSSIEVLRPISRRKVWIVGGSVAALLLAVPLGWLSWQHHVIERKLAAIGARGEPLTPADLEALYERPPAEQDCTALYMYHEGAWARTLGAQSRSFPIMGDGGEPPRLDEPWDDLPAIEQFLSDNHVVFAQLHEAAARGGRARFPIAFEVGFSALLPYTQTMRWISRCLALEAHVRAYRGDAAGAADSLHAGIISGRAVENEPLMVSQLVRMAINTTALEELKRLLPQAHFAADDLARLQADLEAVDFRAGIRRGLLGDRVLAILTAKDPGKMGYSGRVNGKLMTAAHYTTQGHLLSGYLAESDRLLAAVEKPWSQMLGRLPLTQPRFQNTYTSDWDLLKDFVGDMSGYVRAGLQATTANQLGILALALARYRLDHEQFPEELADLVPAYLAEVPLDPSTGAPFRYSVDERGLLLYRPWQVSGWKVPTDPETGASFELLFRWESPAQRPDR